MSYEGLEPPETFTHDVIAAARRCFGEGLGHLDALDVCSALASARDAEMILDALRRCADARAGTLPGSGGKP
jgi:hypothetical protein